MAYEETISRLEDFKAALREWKETVNLIRREELRSYINQNQVWARREVAEAGCFQTITISPPPAVGGLVMRNVDPFDIIFDPPYFMNVVSIVTDMIDRAIGVLKSGGPEIERQSIKVETDILEGYAFIAMPINPNDPNLEDVLDAIKETATRCGLHAERVDESPSNDQITDRILQSIRRAQFVIVDLTNSKPNVFYEAGYAQGLGKTPIYVAREGTKLEFDLKDYPVIFFKNMKQLKDLLEKRLRGLAKAREKT